jgi:hypothetical protein
LSPDQARGLPAAVETDVFRALALSPAVSFTTPLSARPLVRGFDAAATSVRIDGHEVFNLYHLGRVFSAFPADAAQQIGLTAAPARVSEGGALSGLVDIVGRSGALEGIEGGADLSLASAATWLGGGGRARAFGAVRVAYLGLIAALASQPSPYDFQDFYGSLVYGAAGRPSGRLSVFASRDELDTDADSMSWNNVLLGSRFQLLDRATVGVAHSIAVTGFTEDAPAVRARNSTIAVRNRLIRVSSGLEAAIQGPGFRIMLGAGGGWRTMSNVIAPLRGSRDVIPRDVRTDRLELSAFAEWGQVLGPASVQVGLRLDATGDANAVQPRGRVQVPLGRDVAISAGVGRTAQLYHFVAEPRSEPDLTFYDIWLSAADSGIPVATADHAAVDLDLTRGAWSGRLSVFAARARGLVELRPDTDPTPTEQSQFRIGRGSTHGLELQLGLGGTAARASSFSVAYVLSASERDWGSGWVPWSQDRRHLVRLLGQLKLSARWAIFGMLEAQSGAALTPVDQVLLFERPGGSDRLGPSLSYVYGAENGMRSPGTARLDAGARWRFGGPWGSQAALGLSVLNLTFGPVAPVTPKDPERLGTDPPTIRIEWERLFVLPPIPTVTFRLEF